MSTFNIAKTWVIRDWAGNDLTYHHGKFNDFDAAECALSVFLGDNYDTDREEYFIEQDQD